MLTGVLGTTLTTVPLQVRRAVHRQMGRNHLSSSSIQVESLVQAGAGSSHFTHDNKSQTKINSPFQAQQNLKETKEQFYSARNVETPMSCKSIHMKVVRTLQSSGKTYFQIGSITKVLETSCPKFLLSQCHRGPIGCNSLQDPQNPCRAHHQNISTYRPSVAYISVVSVVFLLQTEIYMVTTPIGTLYTLSILRPGRSESNSR